MLKRLLILVAAVCLPIVSAQAEDLKDMSWDDIVDQAKTEGQITWFIWYNQPRLRKTVKSFEQKYGIKVTISDGSNKANIDKLLAEKGRKVGDIDVMATGGGQMNIYKVRDLFYGPIKPILPDGGKLTYKIEAFDNMGYGPAYEGNQTCIAYNPALIKEADLPRTVDQFAAYFDKNPGMFGFNTQNGGSGPSFFRSITRAIVKDVDYADGTSTPDKLAKLQPAWDWFKKHKKGFIITASNNDSIERLNSGEFPMVAAWESQVIGLQHKGEISEDIKCYIPTFGMVGGGNVVYIPANARHKAAALVFINWLTSAATQTALAKTYGNVPMNPDAEMSAGLVPSNERKYATTWTPNPFGLDIQKAFVEKVTLN